MLLGRELQLYSKEYSADFLQIPFRALETVDMLSVREVTITYFPNK